MIDLEKAGIQIRLLIIFRQDHGNVIDLHTAFDGFADVPVQHAHIGEQSVKSSVVQGGHGCQL